MDRISNMRKITDIYKEYKIMPQLQMHQFRVTGVAMTILDSINNHVLVHKEEIIKACLLHDMGNILKFNLDLFPGFSEPEGAEYWKKIKNEYKEKYGDDEHTATSEIVKELGVSNTVFELIKSISFLGASETANGEDFSKKIVEYCDDRVSPFGVISLEGRLADLRKRYAHKGASDNERDNFENAIR